MKQDKQIIFIVGPTAVGKSKVAVALAKDLNGEIISCDSMQIYKEIAVASNKPSEEELKATAHHLIDVASVEEEFNVVRFNELATGAIRDILERDKVPIIVAGSGMYMKILLDGIFKGSGKDDQVRNSLMEKAEKEGNEVLYKQLQQVDKQAASKIHPNDTRRIVRALEVFETTHKPISQLQQQREGLWGHYDIRIYGLRKKREALYEIINNRVDVMFDNGLIDEVKFLQSLDLSLTAKHLIGVKEILSFLNGEMGDEQAKEKMKQNTRNLAKRQTTWFKKEKRIDWIDNETGCASSVVEEILKKLEAE